jgi:KTSC domain
MVEMQFVQSGTVEAVGYDVDASELHVRFNSSPSAYIYQGVPQDVFDRLMASPSKGSFLNREVIKVYPFYRG